MARDNIKKTEGWRAKQWYDIIAPEMFGKSYIGQTIADDPEKLIGRNIEVTLGELMNDISRQNTKMILKIDHVGGNSAYTKYVGHELTQDYLRSLIKREASSIDSNVLVTTNDGYTVRVKPSGFTIKRAREKQIKAIRDIMNNVAKTKAQEMDMEHFLQEVVTGKLSANIYNNAKPIYPLRRVEIRKMRIETGTDTS